MSYHLIRVIAAYEMRTLLRSWFFRIFAAGAIVGLCIFNLAVNLEASGAPWLYKALSSSVPYANLIILNLGQAIVAVLLGSEFLKQDRKNDTVEVIYARSMTNGQYIIGKTLGILSVFFILNVIVLLIGIGFSFLSNVTAMNILAYFSYLLLISLPTLVFILGLTFFLMTIIKNQAVTFIILIGYISLTIFYLNKKAFHLFDYIAYQVPMMYSTISGFADINQIILHRGIYLILGVGLIFLTIYKLERLPQSNKNVHLPLFAGLLMLIISGGMVYCYLNNKISIRNFRKHAIEINNKYCNYNTPVIDSCKIELEHNNNVILVNSTLFINNTKKSLPDTLIFSLNPGLLVNEIKINDQKAAFNRDLQIIKVKLPENLKLPEYIKLNINYSGTIDEKIAFIDLPDKTFEDNPNFEVFRLQKRFAFLQDNYVCLTSESLWYPIAGTGYATSKPLKYLPDFVKYSLTVKTKPSLVALSQGNMKKIKDGLYEFTPEYALPKISLLIGNYQKYSVNVDSVEYSVFSIKGNDYYKTYFDEAIDTIPELIRKIKNEYESDLGLKYPFKRLILAEVPVHFALDKHLYSFSSDAVQPEMIFFSEKGVLSDNTDFRSRKYRLERNMKYDNKDVLPVEIQSALFTNCIKSNLMSKRGSYFSYEDIINWQTYTVFPQYFTFFTQIRSNEWPVLNIAAETYLNERNNSAINEIRGYQGLSLEEKINLELATNSLSDLLSKNSLFEKNEITDFKLIDLVQIKGIQLFDNINSQLNNAAFDSILNDVIISHANKPIQFEELNNIFNNQLKIDLKKEVNSWYIQKTLPGYIIKNLSCYKVPDNNFTKYQVRFQISNTENADGFITINIEFKDPNRNNNENYNGDVDFKVDFSKKVFLPAKSAFDVGFVFNMEVARMSVITNISKNLPNNLIFNLSGFAEEQSTSLFDEIKPLAYFENDYNKNELIVDNEDKGFSSFQRTNEAYLKKMINKNKKERYKYSSIWAYNPPRIWRTALQSGFYGNYIHSALYTRSGTGERTATWKTALPSAGTYEIYYYIDKYTGWRRSNKIADYNINIYHDNGVDKINYSPESGESGWVYLGSWYLSSDSAMVEISNKSNAEMIFADAVKWVLNE